MRRYLLDTNIISDLIRNPRGKAAQHLVRVGEDKVCTSVVVAAELRYGCAKIDSQPLRAAVAALLDELEILPLEPPADAEYGKLRARLEAAGTPIGSNDLLIAAHALAEGTTLVTANVREFERVPGLEVQNWLE